MNSEQAALVANHKFSSSLESWRESLPNGRRPSGDETDRIVRVSPGDTVTVRRGTQGFGSGDYHSNWGWIGAEPEIISETSFDTNFTHGEDVGLRVTGPGVIATWWGDSIGEGRGRYVTYFCE